MRGSENSALSTTAASASDENDATRRAEAQAERRREPDPQAGERPGPDRQGDQLALLQRAADLREQLVERGQHVARELRVRAEHALGQYLAIVDQRDTADLRGGFERDDHCERFLKKLVIDCQLRAMSFQNAKPISTTMNDRPNP